MLRFKLALVLFCFACLAGSASGNTYYVSNHGNDGNSGLDTTHSWLTCYKACTAVSPGDSVLFMGGTYKENNNDPTLTPNYTFQPMVSGTSSAWIYYGVAPGYSRPIIGSYGSDYANYGMVIGNSGDFYPKLKNVQVEGFVNKKTVRGIMVMSCSLVTISYCVSCSTGNVGADGNNAGVITYPSGWSHWGVTVDACTLFYNNETPNVTETDHNSGGFLTYNTFDAVFKNNVVYSSPHGVGMYIKEGNHNIMMENNTIYNMVGGGIYLTNNTDSSTVRYNTIYNCGGGIIFGGYWHPNNNIAYPRHNISEVQYFNYRNKVYNNTIYASGQGVNEYLRGDAQFGSECFNNIAFGTYGIARSSGFSEDSLFRLDYNCYYNPSSSTVTSWLGTTRTLPNFVAAIHYDSHSVNVNPVFVDPVNHDFRLTISSPQALKTGGRGGAYPVYMGAIDPTGGGPVRIYQSISKSSTQTTAAITDDLSGGTAPYDSLVLHWSTVRANVVNLNARDTRVTNASDPYVFTKTSLNPSTKYYFRILAYDIGANGDTTAIDSVTTAAVPYIDQIIAKTSTVNSVTLTDDLSGGTAPYDSLILHWSTIRANVVSLTARDTRVTAASDPYVFIKTSLTPSTKYYFRVLAFDTGVIGDTTAIDSVTTTAVPYIDQIIAKTSTMNSVTLTDDLSGGAAPYDSLVLHWSTIRANVVSLTARDTRVTAASDPYVFTKTSLNPSTKYYFRILAYDIGANGDTTAIDSITTSAQPSIDQIVSKTSTDTQVSLNDDLSGGSAPYDSLILYWSTTRANIVNLSARDIKVTAAADPYQFSKTGLTANTKYYFRISAFDSGSLGDTTAIDSAMTTVTGLQLLSINVPDTVCGTYSGYNQTPVNDGVIAPRGGTSSTWASDQSSTSAHWVTMYFNTPKVIQRVRLNWAWNAYSSAFMTSRQYYIQYWDASGGIFRDAAVVNNSTVDSATTTDFTPVTTTRIRYYQPANMGPTIYSTILWITELQIYGTDPQDNTPPVLSGIAVSNIAPTTATVNWSSNEPATSQVDYGLTTSYGMSTTLDNTLLLNHSQNLSGLSPLTTYHYRVKSRDAAGNLATSGDFTFTTISATQLLSVNVPDTVCGTYSGYNQTPVNDGVIAPRGGTSSTWASDQSSTSAHWVTMYFSSPKVVQRVRLNWAWNAYSSAFMTSRQYYIQYWDASGGIFRDAAVVNNSTVDSATTTDFTPVTTTRIRYYQPANMGPTIYSTILWITELQIYGYDVPMISGNDPNEQLISGYSPEIVSQESLTSIPTEYSLKQSYPNPFNAQTTIEYGLPTASQVSLIIYDITGRIVEELINEFQPAGYHKVIWNAGDQPSGMYFYRIAANEFAETRKTLLLK